MNTFKFIWPKLPFFLPSLNNSYYNRFIYDSELASQITQFFHDNFLQLSKTECLPLKICCVSQFIQNAPNFARVCLLSITRGHNHELWPSYHILWPFLWRMIDNKCNEVTYLIVRSITNNRKGNNRNFIESHSVITSLPVIICVRMRRFLSTSDTVDVL